jgi:hypothetical protein
MKVPQKEIDWAVQVAEKLPDKFQQSGFSELLHYALFKMEDEVGSHQNKSVQKLIMKLPVTDVSADFPDLHRLAKKGNRDQHVAWAVAELYMREEEVNNNSIRQIIKEHLAITPPSRQNTNRSLRNLTPKFILRTKNGRKYAYAPTPKFTEIFVDLKEDKNGDSK